MGLSLVTGPPVEPLSLAAARMQLRDPPTDEDGLVADLIVAARERAEAVTGRTLVATTYDLSLECEPDYVLYLPKPPLRSITSVTYLDVAGVSQTWASSSYQVDAPAGAFAQRGRIMPAPFGIWPIVQAWRFNALTVRFVAGYGTTGESVPQAIRQAMLLMIAGWYEHREAFVSDLTTPLGALALLTPYKTFD